MRQITFEVSERVYRFLRRIAKDRGLVAETFARIVLLRELVSIRWAEASARGADVDPNGPALPVLPPRLEDAGELGLDDIDTEIFDDPPARDLRDKS